MMQLMDSVDDRKKYLIAAEKLRKQVGRRLENKVQRASKRYDDDGHSKVIGLKLLLLAAVITAAKALPPQPNMRQMTKGFQCSIYRGNNSKGTQVILLVYVQNIVQDHYYC